MVDRSMPALLRDLRNRVTSLERRLARSSYQLPPRLQQTGEQVADWNDAVQVGFYSAPASASHAPEALALVGRVFYEGVTGAIAQEVFSPSAEPSLRGLSWRRVYSGGAWSPWLLVPNRAVYYSERVATNITNVTTTWVQVTPISVAFTLARPSRVLISTGLITFSSVVQDVVSVEVRDGAASLQSWTGQANSSPSSAGRGNAHHWSAYVDLGVGAHTLTLWISRADGSGAVTVAPSPNNKTWLSAEVVG